MRQGPHMRVEDGYSPGHAAILAHNAQPRRNPGYNMQANFAAPPGLQQRQTSDRGQQNWRKSNGCCVIM
ncbi:hypothetical protein HBH69_234620 [Parastagonospora nodorum]|nr:hypothetical protein HBH69_234620 [Parastagonospora nodorum]